MDFASGLHLGRAFEAFRRRYPDDLLSDVLLRSGRPDDDLLLLLRRPDDDGLAVRGPDGAADLELLGTSNVDRTLGKDLEGSLAWSYKKIITISQTNKPSSSLKAELSNERRLLFKINR